MNPQQRPSDLQVIEFQYRHVGTAASDIAGYPYLWTGKLVVLPPEYRWLLQLDDNPQAYGEVWEDFNDSAIVIEYVDIVSGETVEGKLIQLLSPDPNADGLHMLVTDELIQQLTPTQIFKVWEALENGIELPEGEDRAALSASLWSVLQQLQEDYLEYQLGAALLGTTASTAGAIVKGVVHDWVVQKLLPVEVTVVSPSDFNIEITIRDGSATGMERIVSRMDNIPLRVMYDLEGPAPDEELWDEALSSNPDALAKLASKAME